MWWTSFYTLASGTKAIARVASKISQASLAQKITPSSIARSVGSTTLPGFLGKLVKCLGDQRPLPYAALIKLLDCLSIDAECFDPEKIGRASCRERV